MLFLDKYSYYMILEYYHLYFCKKVGVLWLDKFTQSHKQKRTKDD